MKQDSFANFNRNQDKVKQNISNQFDIRSHLCNAIRQLQQKNGNSYLEDTFVNVN